MVQLNPAAQSSGISVPLLAKERSIFDVHGAKELLSNLWRDACLGAEKVEPLQVHVNAQPGRALDGVFHCIRPFRGTVSSEVGLS